jgi:hypothetical protein
MSKLPPNVEAQSRRSEELIENLNKPTEEVQEIQPQVEEIPPPVIDPPEEIPQESAPPAPQRQTTSLEEELAIEKQRNDSLKGITEVNKTHIAEQKEQIKRLEEQLEQAMSAPKEPQNYAEGAFSEEDVENLGPEYVEALQKSTNLAVEKALAIQKAELDKVYQTQAQSQEQALWSSVVGRLGMNQASFNELDESPEFNQWLKQPDGMSGYTLGESLSHAVGRNDTEGIAKFYEAYRGQQGKVPSPKKPITTQKGQTVQVQIDTGNQKRYSKSEYLNIVSKWTSGRLRNWSKEQFDKYCLEIDRAHVEGRLDP